MYFDPIRQFVRWMQRQFPSHSVTVDLERLREQQEQLGQLIKELDRLRGQVPNKDVKFRKDTASEHSWPEEVRWHLDTEAVLQSQPLDEKAIQKYAAVLTEDQRHFLFTFMRDAHKTKETEFKITLRIDNLKTGWMDYLGATNYLKRLEESSAHLWTKDPIEVEALARTIDALLHLQHITTAMLLLTVERSRFSDYLDRESQPHSPQKER